MNNNTTSTPTSEFNRIKDPLWPVHNHEIKRVVGMVLILTLIYLLQTIFSRIGSDELADLMGQYMGQYNAVQLKYKFVLPATVIYLIAYVIGCYKYGQSRMFVLTHIILLIYVVFYIFLPATASRTWPRLTLYVIAKVWSAVAVPIFFWLLANQTTSINQARRFYPLYLFLAGYLSGLTKILQYIITSITTSTGPAFSVKHDLRYVLAYFTAMLAVYIWLNRNLQSSHTPDQAINNADAPKQGLLISILRTLSSPHVWLIALLVFLLHLSCETLLVSFSVAPLLKVNYNQLKGIADMALAVTNTIVTPLIGIILLRKYSWKTTATIIPLIVLGAAVTFVLASDNTTTITTYIQFIASNVVTATIPLFTLTKEIAYIPLQRHTQTNGKVLADGLIAPVGSIIGLLLARYAPLMGSEAGLLYKPIILAVAVITWLYAIKKLAPKIDAADKQHNGV